MIIGVTGPISSGKGKVAEFFREKGFVHHSFSREIREVAKERGIEINRKNLTKLGAKLRKESAKSILAKRIVETIEKEIDKGASRWVVEGLRDTDELRMFREYEFDNKKMRFVLIAVDAPQELRYERMKKRGRHGEPQSFEEFKEMDDKEIHGGAGQEVGKLIEMADYVIDNSGTLDELKEQVEKIGEEVV